MNRRDFTKIPAFSFVGLTLSNSLISQISILNPEIKEMHHIHFTYCYVPLSPGESICLEQGVYHRFYGEPGKGKVLVGEVSMVNDDASDNRFYEPVGRFPEIIEDEEPLHLLASDYRKFI